jgi:hypothetical protein
MKWPSAPCCNAAHAKADAITMKCWTQRSRLAAVVALLGACALPASAAPSTPAPGRYEARLCTARLDGAAPDCGPAEAELHRGGRMRVQVSDIVYRLELRSSQVDVVLMHGTMQIDEFTAPCEWVGPTLRFTDAQKGLRYELWLGNRRR